MLISGCQAKEPELADAVTESVTYRAFNIDNVTVEDADGVYSLENGKLFFGQRSVDESIPNPLEGTELCKVGKEIYYLADQGTLIKVDTTQSYTSTSLGLTDISHFAAGINRIYYFVGDSGYCVESSGKHSKIPDKTEGIFMLYRNQLIYSSGDKLMNISLLSGKQEQYTGEVKGYQQAGDAYRFTIGSKEVDIR